MSGFFEHLVARAQPAPSGLEPRRPSRFEPAPRSGDEKTASAAPPPGFAPDLRPSRSHASEDAFRARPATRPATAPAHPPAPLRASPLTSPPPPPTSHPSSSDDDKQPPPPATRSAKTLDVSDSPYATTPASRRSAPASPLPAPPATSSASHAPDSAFAKPDSSASSSRRHLPQSLPPAAPPTPPREPDSPSHNRPAPPSALAPSLRLARPSAGPAPATPPRAAAEELAPVVRIHIGSIEVRAIMPTPSPAAPARAAVPPRPAQSLDDYLARRSGAPNR